MTHNLDDFGGALRCVLRVRENGGNEVIPDRDFLRLYAEAEISSADTPGWNLRPLKKAAAALSLRFDFQTSTSYEELLGDHRAGHDVLIRIQGSQLGLQSHDATDFRVTVLADINEREMSLWCPLRNGLWELLPSVSRNRWEEIQGLGLTLFDPART